MKDEVCVQNPDSSRWVCHLRTGFTGEHGGDAGLMVGLHGLKDLFQSEQFHDFVIPHEIVHSVF